MSDDCEMIRQLDGIVGDLEIPARKALGDLVFDNYRSALLRCNTARADEVEANARLVAEQVKLKTAQTFLISSLGFATLAGVVMCGVLVGCRIW